MDTPQRTSKPPPVADREVRVEIAGGLCDIILDRRAKKSTLALSSYELLQQAFATAANDDAAKVVILRAAGGAFCTGNDLDPRASPEEVRASNAAFGRAQAQLLRGLAAFEKPVVAAVGGLAADIGVMLLLYCDIVIASEFAALEFSEVRRGLVPDGGCCAVLEERLGLPRATEWLLLGERMKADEALRLGLVNAVVPLENLHSSSRARAEALAALPQTSAREANRRLRERFARVASSSYVR